MTRRDVAGAAALAVAGGVLKAQSATGRMGVDLFSVRSQNWGPLEALDYCAKLGAKVVHFSEIRFLGGLDEANVRRVRERADQHGITLELGMRSVCPTSKSFDPAQGTAEEQLGRLLAAARVAKSNLVRCFLGSSQDRTGDKPIEHHIEQTVKVLRNMKSRAQDANLMIAVENHAGDMQARELKMLVEEAGKDFVGVCLDAGNPVWALEDPHLTLESLAPYVLTSHIRDSHVWRVPEGIAVAWTRIGEGNVDIPGWIGKYRQLCPGRPLSLEIIMTGPRVYKVMEPGFWNGYRNVRAEEFTRFLKLAEKGPVPVIPPIPKEEAVARERADLEKSAEAMKKLLA